MLALYGAGLATTLDLEQQLAARYQGQILSLRHPLMSHKQDYTFEGVPIAAGSEGPWTLYGRVRIDHIAADSHRLQTKATRIFCWFDKNKLNQAADKQQVTITVRLDHPLAFRRRGDGPPRTCLRPDAGRDPQLHA